MTIRKGWTEIESVQRTVHANLSFVLQITFVRDNNNGERVLILYSQDLLMEGTDFFKRVPGRDGIYEQEAFACAHVLFPHSTIQRYVRVSSIVRISDYGIMNNNE